MKLMIMIPCLNEESTLPLVLEGLPRHIPGIARIETLIVDDGSTDNTVGVARELGVDHIVRLKQHQGLARAFQAGIDACLDLGADVIVNTDGDNQYPSAAIPSLIEPVLRNEADIVVGDRQTQTIEEFSRLKKLLQRWGSWAVRTLSGVPDVRDAVSGFRAYSRSAAARIHLTSSFSYTIESIILAGKTGLRIQNVPIRTNNKTRPSRLYKTVPGFLARSLATLIRAYATYEPLKVFLVSGLLSAGVGAALGVRFVYFMATGDSVGHVQSLILAAVLVLGGVMLGALGILADLIATNRRLTEELLWREKVAKPARAGSGSTNGAVHDHIGTEMEEALAAREVAGTRMR